MNYYKNKITGELLTKKEALTFWCNEYDGNDPEKDIPFSEVFEKVEKQYLTLYTFRCTIIIEIGNTK